MIRIVSFVRFLEKLKNTRNCFWELLTFRCIVIKYKQQEAADLKQTLHYISTTKNNKYVVPAIPQLISIILICLHIRLLILSITLIRKLRIFCEPQWFESVKLYAMLKIILVCQLDLIKAADFITGFTSRLYRQH